MKLINEIKFEEIDYQIEIRKKLIGEMVGRVYPAILLGEIQKLKSMKCDFIQEVEMQI